MKLARSTTFNPEKMLSVVIVSPSILLISHRYFIDLGTAARAFAEMPAYLPVCLASQHTDRRMKPRVPGPLPDWSPILCSPLPVNTEPRLAHSQKPVSGLLRRG